MEQQYGGRKTVKANTNAKVDMAASFH